MRKIYLFLLMLILSIGSTWADGSIAVDRTNWTIRAYSEPSSNIENTHGGMIATAIDGDLTTWYHSDWLNGGDNAKTPIQGFMIQMADAEYITKVQYIGRTDQLNTHATSYRVYALTETEYTSFGVQMNTITGITDRNTALSATTLGTATASGTFTWTSGNNSEAKDVEINKDNVKYILFLADGLYESSNYLTCAEFNAYKKVSSITYTVSGGSVVYNGITYAEGKTITLSENIDESKLSAATVSGKTGVVTVSGTTITVSYYNTFVAPTITDNYIPSVSTSAATSIATGKYYVIKGFDQTNQIATGYLYNNSGSIGATSTLTVDNNYIWYVYKESGDNYYLYNMAQKKFVTMGTSSGSTVSFTSDDKWVQFTSSDVDTVFAIKNSTCDQWIDFGSTGCDPKSWGGGCSGSRRTTFYEVEYTEYDLVISSGETAKVSEFTETPSKIYVKAGGTLCVDANYDLTAVYGPGTVEIASDYTLSGSKSTVATGTLKIDSGNTFSLGSGDSQTNDISSFTAVDLEGTLRVHNANATVKNVTVPASATGCFNLYDADQSKSISLAGTTTVNGTLNFISTYASKDITIAELKGSGAVKVYGTDTNATSSSESIAYNISDADEFTGSWTQKNTSATTTVAGNLVASTWTKTNGTLNYTGTSLTSTTLDGVALTGSARVNVSGTLNLANISNSLTAGTNGYAFVAGNNTVMNFTGTSDLTNGGNNSYNKIGGPSNATINVNSGSLTVGGLFYGSGSNAAVTVASGATLVTSGSSNTNQNVSFASATISGTATIAGDWNGTSNPITLNNGAVLNISKTVAGKVTIADGATTTINVTSLTNMTTDGDAAYSDYSGTNGYYNQGYKIATDTESNISKVKYAGTEYDVTSGVTTLNDGIYYVLTDDVKTSTATMNTNAKVSIAESKTFTVDTDVTLGNIITNDNAICKVTGSKTLTVGTAVTSGIDNVAKIATSSKTFTYNVQTGSTVKDNRYFKLTGGTMNVTGGGTMEAYGISLTSEGSTATTFNVGEGTTWHITGTETSYSSGSKGAFNISHWNAAATVNIAGTFICDAGISNVDGNSSVININDGGTLRMTKGLTGVTRWGSSPKVNVNDGGTLEVWGVTTADQKLAVTLANGATLLGSGDDNTTAVSIAQAMTVASGATINVEAATSKTLTVSSDLTTDGLNTSGTTTLSGVVTIAKTIQNSGTLTLSGSSLAATSIGNFDAGTGGGFSGDDGNGFATGNFYVVKNADNATASITATNLTYGDESYALTKGTSGDATISITGTSGAYYINNDATYSTVATKLTSDGDNIVLNGGVLTIDADMVSGTTKPISMAKDATVTINEGKTLTQGYITGNYTLTINGAGTYTTLYSLSSNKALGATIGTNWTGTVVPTTQNIDGGVNFNTFVNGTSSKVKFTGIQGWITAGSTSTANVVLENGSTDYPYGFMVNGANSYGATYTMNGKISGSGDFYYSQTDSRTNDWVFGGDLSEWTGLFRTVNTGTVTFKITKAGTVAAGAKNESTGTLKVEPTVDGVTFAGDITDCVLNIPSDVTSIGISGTPTISLKSITTATSLNINMSTTDIKSALGEKTSCTLISCSGNNSVSTVTINGGSVIVVDSKLYIIEKGGNDIVLHECTDNYFKMKSVAQSKYVTCNKKGGTEYNLLLSDDNTAEAEEIFHFVDNKLQAYNNNHFVDWTCNQGQNGGASQFIIEASDIDAQFYVKATSDINGNGNYPYWNAEETYMGCVASASADAQKFTMEVVYTLPERTTEGQQEVGNALTYAPAGTTVSENVPNVLVATDEDDTYTCGNLQLTDDVIATLGSTSFTNTKVTYSRAATTSKWGTVILPYVPTEEDGVSYYELTSSTGTSLTFTKVETANLAENTPYMFKKTTEGGLSAAATSATFSLGGVKKEGTEYNNFLLVGILKNSSIVDASSTEAKTGYDKIVDPKAYYFNNSDNKFYSLNTRFSMKAFRCYLRSTSTDDEARQAVLGFSAEEGGKTTGISFVESADGKTVDVIFDMNGRRQQNIQNGVNIINGKKVIK